MLYAHIPFCHSVCLYCDFCRVAGKRLLPNYLTALDVEAASKPSASPLTTIYVGGGTPSLLSATQTETLGEIIHGHYNTHSVEEFTYEVNPEDATPDYMLVLKKIGVTRISMGIQSLDDRVLKHIGRRHTAADALEGVRIALSVFTNLSVDLIYGLPGQRTEDWEAHLTKLLRMGVVHISLYALQLESPRLMDMVRKGRIALPTDEEVADQYNTICRMLRAAEWDHYEISNFARSPALRSRHNSGYWSGKPYIGIGAGASGFDGTNRRYTNTGNVEGYASAATTARIPEPDEAETLTPKDLYNEFVMLRLRTKEGFRISEVADRFGQGRAEALTEAIAQVNPENIETANGVCRIPESKYLLYNDIVSRLFA